MIETVKRLLRSQLSRRVGGVAAYTAIGHVLSLAAAPILTRLVTPDEFGALGLLVTFAMTAGAFACLYYDVAIPVPADDDEASGLATGALGLGVTASLLLGAAVAILSWRGLFGFGTFSPWIGAVMAILIATQSAVFVLQGWQVRCQRVVVVGEGALSLNGVRAGAQLGLASAGGGWLGLIAGEIAGRAANALHLHLRSPKDRPIRWCSPWNALRAYRRFPVVLMPAQALDALVSFVQAGMLVMFFGSAGLGQFFLMKRTLDLPLAFAARAVTDVLYGRFLELARTEPGALRGLYVRAFLALLCIGLAGALPLVFLGPKLFAFAFGAEWKQAGILAAIMAPAAALNFAVAPVARIFALTKAPFLRYGFSIASILAQSVALLTIWYAKLDLVAATMAISGATVSAYLAYFAAGWFASAQVNVTRESAANG